MAEIRHHAQMTTGELIAQLQFFPEDTPASHEVWSNEKSQWVAVPITNCISANVSEYDSISEVDFYLDEVPAGANVEALIGGANYQWGE